jgi:MFS family permease
MPLRVAASARFTLLATILGSSIVFIDATVVNVALPPVQRDLGGGLAAQQWVVDAYMLTLGSFILVGGSLGDIFGPVRVFRVGVTAFGIASLLCALAPTANVLIVCHGLQGVAGALLTPASLAVITTTFGGAERGTAIGTWTAWSGASTVLGPLLGGWLIGISSWRVIFLLNLPIVAAALGLALTKLTGRRRGARACASTSSAAFSAPSGSGASSSASSSSLAGWSDPVVAGGLALGTACLVAFVLWELRVRQPMLPLSLFKRRNFSVTNIETFAVYGGLSAWGFFLALARLPEQLDYRRDLLPSILVFGLGLALTVAPLTTTVLSDAGAGDAGIASGVNNAVSRVAGLLAIAVIGIPASGASGRLSTQGFHTAMLITGVLLCVGGAIGGLGIRNPR